MMHSGPKMMHSGPKIMHFGPKMMHSGPKMMHSVPKMMHSDPKMIHFGPKMMIQQSDVTKILTPIFCHQHHDVTSITVDLRNDVFYIFDEKKFENIVH